MPQSTQDRLSEVATTNLTVAMALRATELRATAWAWTEPS